MFRNPRDNYSIVVDKTVLPSTGRPPTPPSREQTTRPTASPYISSDGNANKMPTASSPTKLPIPRKQPAAKASDVKRNGFKQNQSILSFFGKAVTTPAAIGALQEDALFFQDPTKRESPSKPVRAYSCHEGQEGKNAFGGLESSASRFNETENPVKRRKLSSDHFELAVRTPSPEPIPYIRQQSSTSVAVSLDGAVATRTQKQFRHRGGFLDNSDDDSDDDNDEEDVENHNLKPANAKSARNESRQEIQAEAVLDGANDALYEVSEVTNTTAEPLKLQNGSNSTANRVSEAEPGQQSTILPSLSRQGTSIFIPGDFDEADDFENDEFFEGGEEFMERRWMAEQQEMEMDFDEDSKSESDGSVLTLRDNEILRVEDSGAAENACPICNSSLQCLSEIQALSHVNACLDGTATALPALGLTTKDANTKQESTPTALKSSNLDRASSRIFKRAAVARPGQSNPFALAKEEKTNGGSAFSLLMSGHAEDAAWAEAATNENQSRGKPAYQRTCPFYKIMPGFYIAVDAFRYGKVEGQNAYFLSHFHSDHYIGLTSSWCHGPIYASKVTTNLIIQQLRVDAKWLVPLEFEKKVEVPNTKGVSVTMIPANHCPGSSLYLFEKNVGKNKDGSTRMNRVLHCGDFRACPAHVYHPLLKPDILDTVTGLTKQQTIDTCYLDTTYLTPKYAFPSQHDVIDACAQMCVSLSKEIPDGSDSWEKAKLERAGSTMTKFLEIDDRGVKKEEAEEVDVKSKLRGKLLVVIGTYSIGKERICLGIARALGSKIYAPPAKMRICSCLEDEELNSLLTKNPLEAQVHMQTLMEIRAETLHDYLITYKGHFSRVVGFRPTGWSYRPPTSRFTENPAINTVLHSEGWKSHFTMRDLAPQRGSTKESNCFGVPYSEHSSFRELTMFCCALRIGRVVPTVNVGSAKSREKMKGWIEKWEAEKKRNGLFKVEVGAEGWGSGDGKLRYGV